MSNNDLAWKIFEMLKEKGAEIGNASVPLIHRMLDENSTAFATRLAERIAELEARREKASPAEQYAINGQIGLIQAVTHDYSEATNE